MHGCVVQDHPHGGLKRGQRGRPFNRRTLFRAGDQDMDRFCRCQKRVPSASHAAHPPLRRASAAGSAHRGQSLRQQIGTGEQAGGMHIRPHPQQQNRDRQMRRHRRTVYPARRAGVPRALSRSDRHAHRDDRLARPFGIRLDSLNKLELQTYSIRHLQQHVGELSGRLDREANISIDWIGHK